MYEKGGGAIVVCNRMNGEEGMIEEPLRSVQLDLVEKQIKYILSKIEPSALTKDLIALKKVPVLPHPIKNMEDQLPFL